MILDISRSEKPYFDGVVVCHNCYMITLTVKGHGYKRAGERVIDLKPGTIVCAPPNTPQQSFSVDGMEDIVIYSTRLFSDQRQGERVLTLSDNSIRTAGSLFDMAFHLFQQRNIFLADFLDEVFGLIVSFLENQHDQVSHDPRVMAVTMQLQEVFSQTDLSVDRVLQEHGNNSDYLRRLFKRSHGCTPIQYVTRLRIGKAKLLLEGNSLHHYSVTEIATLSGFSDVSYFSRVFREHFGFSPSQYERLFPGV